MKKLDLATRVWMDLQRLPERAGAELVVGAMVEGGALCNLRCPFCPTGNGELTLSREFLRLADFRAILDALGPRLRRLLLYNWGEPLLNPEIDAMFAAADARGIETVVSSNLALPPSSFTPARAESLIRSGLRVLQVSFGGVTQETYEVYRVGGRLAHVLANLRLLLETKRRLRAERPEIVWLFHVHRQNQGDVPAARTLAAELGVPIRFKTLIFPDAAAGEWAVTEEAPPPGKKARAAGKAAAPSREPVVRGKLCLQTWSTPIVHSDGTVLPCCVVNNPEYALGNVREEPLDEVWNKPLIVAMRRYLKTGRRPRRKLPCYGCPHDPHGAP